MSGETFVRCYQDESRPSKDPRKEKQVREVGPNGPLQLCDFIREKKKSAEGSVIGQKWENAKITPKLCKNLS